MERQRSWLDVFSLPETLTQEFVKSHALKVADVMTRDVVTAEEEASLAEIANLLERHHVKRLPIVRGGRVVGIVSRANILQAFASLPEATLPEPPRTTASCARRCSRRSPAPASATRGTST